MRKLLPVILALLGLALGAGTGFVLRPKAAPEAAKTKADSAEKSVAKADTHTQEKGDKGASGDNGDYDYAKLANQFVVPLVEKGKVRALVVLSLSLEVSRGTTTQVYGLEPKIRDEFLQALFDYANSGGFSGNYTEGNKMQVLRDSLLETARKVLGPIVFDVLVTGIMRQDV